MTTTHEIDLLVVRARDASSLLKSLSHEARLLIMCHLMDGEKSVSELERSLGRRQAAVSQQLARLRLDGLVRARRDGKTIFYSVASTQATEVLVALRVALSSLEDGYANGSGAD
jgi:DNA-binding transcriptional ArsR family regulator